MSVLLRYDVTKGDFVGAVRFALGDVGSGRDREVRIPALEVIEAARQQGMEFGVAGPVSVQPLRVVERKAIAAAMDFYGGHVTRVARALGISRSTLWRRLQEYRLVESGKA